MSMNENHKSRLIFIIANMVYKYLDFFINGRWVHEIIIDILLIIKVIMYDVNCNGLKM